MRAQYAAVPTPAHFIAAIKDASCVRHIASPKEDFRLLDGAQLAEAFFCEIEAAGCDMPVTAPVWIGANGVMWFGPDSASSLYATECLGQFEGG